MEDTIIVLGGDGYYGWPIALKLAVTHPKTRILIVDNEWRRNTVKRIGSDSLTPIAQLPQRIKAYREVYGNNNLDFVYLDVNSDALEQLIEREQPHTIYHMAQQCSAPYSMLGLSESLYTIQNNEGNNMRLLWAVRKHVPDAHIIKMGSMGEYATSGGIDIAEGYFFPEFNGKKAVSPLPFPRQSDDVYHISKINDSNYISMACRKWGLRITEVMQSTLFGVYTEEMKDCPELFTRFDYDDIFGTVVNRFLTQAVAGHPLTVYGKGNQTTGIMPMKDAVRSLELIAGNVPDRGVHKVVNHVTKANCTINELAEAVKQIAAAKGYDVTINHVFDPRSESAAVKHDIKVMADHVEDNLSTTPINEVLAETFGIIEAQQQRINASAFTHHIHAFEGKYETEEAKATADVVTDERSWISFREQEFSSRRFNLNPGTLGTASKAVQSVRQQQHVQEQVQGNPLGAYEFGRNYLSEIRTLEKKIWNSEGYEVVVANAASQMTNLLALSLIRTHHATAEAPLRVITSANEHPGGIGVFEQLPEFKVYYLRDEVLQNKNQLLDAVIDIKPNIAFLSQVFYATGNFSDTESFCNILSQTTPNCTIILDVTQAIGLYDLPFGKADVLVGSLHKWMFGPQGSGLVWMKPSFMKQIGGLYWNGLGSDEPHLQQFNIQGGQDFVIFGEVLEALKLYQRVGKDVVLQRSRYLAGIFQEQLSAAFDAQGIDHTIVSNRHDSPLLSFGFIDFHPYDLYRELNEIGVHCKCIIDYSGGKKYRHILRFGIPYFETVERLQQAVGTIAEVVAQQKKVLQLHPQNTAVAGKVKQIAA